MSSATEYPAAKQRGLPRGCQVKFDFNLFLVYTLKLEEEKPMWIVVIVVAVFLGLIGVGVVMSRANEGFR